MYATPQNVRDLSRTGEFAALEDDEIQRILDEASTHVRNWSTKPISLTNMMTQQDLGQALLAAHLLVDSANGARGGAPLAPTSLRLGPGAASFAQAPSNGDALRLAGTTYGRRFSELLRGQPICGGILV